MTARTKMLIQAVRDWLRPDNLDLQKAINRTVKEKLFPFEDIKHRILTLKESLNDSSISLIGNKFNDIQLPENQVLVFHPGNIPLCGIEDLITVCLSGAGYSGKLSRRDPWLFQSFLSALEAAGFDRVQMNSNISAFNNHHADALIFSGSGESAETIRSITTSRKMVKESAPELLRTTWFSIAFIETYESRTMRSLVEAVFRYQGMGCRSVAVVISPYSLNSIKCELTDYIEEFWLANPPLKGPPPSLYHRYAYNKAIGRPQAWLDHFLIEEFRTEPDTDFLLHWMTGDARDVAEFTDMYRKGFQCLYTETLSSELPGFKGRRDLLSNAQKPSPDWQPDGIDTARWLIENIDL